MTAQPARSGAPGPPPSFATVIPQPLAQAPERGAFTLGRRHVSSCAPPRRRPSGGGAARREPPTGDRLSAPGRRRGREGGGHRPDARDRRPVARRRGIPARRRRVGRHDHRAPGGRALLGHADTAPAPSAADRGRRPAAGAVARRTRDDPRPAAVRVARGDARRRTALLRRRRGEAADRRHDPLQAQPAPPAPDGRPGMAPRDPLVAAAHEPRRSHRRSAAARAAGSRSVSTRRSSRTRASGSSTSCPRSTCRATSTRRSPRTPGSTCNGVAPAPYTGIEVGFSSLCIGKEATYAFVDDVVREVAALTPGPYIHIGGDEAHSTDPDEYRVFVERVQRIVRAHGKRMLGWEEIAKTRLRRTSVVQHWHDAGARQARGRAGCQARHVPRDEGVPRHEVHPRLAARPDVGRDDDGAGRLPLGSCDAGRRESRRRTSSASRRRSGPRRRRRAPTSTTSRSRGSSATPRSRGHRRRDGAGPATAVASRRTDRGSKPSASRSTARPTCPGDEAGHAGPVIAPRPGFSSAPGHVPQ